MTAAGDIEARFRRIEERMNSFEAKLTQNGKDSKEAMENTKELLDLFRASKFGVAVVKWCATVGGAGVAAWAAWKAGVRP